MKTGDLSGLEVGVLEHLASKLKGLEGVHEISKREKPERRNPARPGAEVCISRKPRSPEGGEQGRGVRRRTPRPRSFAGA